MAVSHVFAGIPTADLATALEFYERFFGKPPDRRPHDHEAVWQLADHGLVYVVADRRRAGHALTTLIVDDLTRALDGLRIRGIDAGRIETIPSNGVRRATIIDPDGNRITLGEVPQQPDT